MLEEKQYLEDVERKEILNEQISKLKYHQQLDEQLNIKEQEKIKVFQQFLKEKEQIDDIVRKIKRENEESQVQKMQQKLATKQQIEEFRNSQTVWREIEERKIAEENIQIKKFIEQKEFRDSEFAKVQKVQRLSEVFIKDPADNRIAQWKDVSLDKGMAQMDMQLDQEPILGK